VALALACSAAAGTHPHPCSTAPAPATAPATAATSAATAGAPAAAATSAPFDPPFTTSTTTIATTATVPAALSVPTTTTTTASSIPCPAVPSAPVARLAAPRRRRPAGSGGHHQGAVTAPRHTATGEAHGRHRRLVGQQRRPQCHLGSLRHRHAYPSATWPSDADPAQSGNHDICRRLLPSFPIHLHERKTDRQGTQKPMLSGIKRTIKQTRNKSEIGEASSIIKRRKS
jgi:hypothetical protein